MVFAVNHSRMPAALSANRVSGSSFSCSDEAITVGGGAGSLYITSKATESLKSLGSNRGSVHQATAHLHAKAGPFQEGGGSRYPGIKPGQRTCP